MKVGGRDFDLTRQEVELLMRNQTPELIQKYVVDVNGIAFPPKQVLGHSTGWARTSFTTMEAQRVLAKIGLVCREAASAGGSSLNGAVGDLPPGPMDDRRISKLQAAIATANIAIAALDDRLRRLEEGGA